MTEIKINNLYEVILLLLKKRLHGRAIAKKLDISLNQVQTVLSRLRSYNVVDYEVDGRNHKHFLKKNLISKSYILSSEYYKLTRILRKHIMLEQLFMEIISKYPNLMIILFGSYAKFTSKKDSDIDIYVETTDKRIKEEIEKINNRINVKIGKFKKSDLLIREIIKNHIILQNGERFYERLRFFKKT